MGIMIHKNPTEESFIHWMSNYPESFHPLDIMRFNEFVDCVIMYNAITWLRFEYFKKRIKTFSPLFDEEKINTYYDKLDNYYAFAKASGFPKVSESKGNHIIRKAKNGRYWDERVDLKQILKH